MFFLFCWALLSVIWTSYLWKAPEGRHDMNENRPNCRWLWHNSTTSSSNFFYVFPGEQSQSTKIVFVGPLSMMTVYGMQNWQWQAEHQRSQKRTRYVRLSIVSGYLFFSVRSRQCDRITVISMCNLPTEPSLLLCQPHINVNRWQASFFSPRRSSLQFDSIVRSA